MAEFDPDAYLDGKKKKSTGFDPDAYLKKTAPESALQTFGRSSASMADSALNALTGTLDYGAYALARAAGRTPEQATAETTSPKDVFGRAFGVAGTPGYEQAPLRQLGTAVGTGLQESVIAPIAQTTGLPEADIGNIVNTAMIGAGPAVPKVAGAAGRGAVNVGRGAVDIGSGVVGGFSGDIAKPGARVRAGQTPSARQPIGETYIPAPVLEQFRAGQITAEQAQAQAVPTSTLPQAALARTGGTVPFEGQGLRAFGEQLGQDYRNPYKLGAELAGDYLLGGIPTVARLGMKGYQGVQGARAASQLEKYGFTPISAQEQAALRAGGYHPDFPTGAVKPSDIPAPIRAEAAARITPVAPQLGYSPEPTPTTIPMAGPGRRVNIEGESFNLPYEIDTSLVQGARPQQAAPVAPAPAPQPAAPRAASTLEALDVAKQDAVAKMVADLQAKKAAETQAAVAGPVVPETTIRPFESAAEVAAITAEDRALAQKTPREAIDQTLKGAITQKGKMDKKLLDETVAAMGLEPVDWTGLGIDWQSQSIKDARKTVAKYIGEQTGLRGAGSRGERQSTQMARVNKAIEAEQALKSPEELAADEARARALIERNNKLRKMGSDRFEMMTDDTGVFKSKQDFKEQQVVDKLSGKFTVGEFTEGNKRNVFYTIEAGPFVKYMSDTFDAKTGEKIGSSKLIELKKVK